MQIFPACSVTAARRLRLPAVSPSLFSHLLQVGVTPYLPISKHPGNQAALAIIFQPLCSRAPLQGADLSSAGSADINRQEFTAGFPEYWVTRCVIYNLQEELPVVVVNLLSPQCAIIINRKNISPIYLWKKIQLKFDTIKSTSQCRI